MKAWLSGVLLGLDQFGNAVFGGSPDETISSRVGRLRDRHKLGRIVDGALGKIESDHGIKSLEYTPWGTVDPHHMPAVREDLQQDWAAFVEVMEPAKDLDAFSEETLAGADRATLRLRYWLKNGGRERWAGRMEADSELEKVKDLL